MTLADADHAGNRRDVAQEIVIEMPVHAGIGRIRCRDHEQRVTVGRGLHDRLGGDVGIGAGTVVDDELLAEPLRQPLRDQPRGGIGRSAGRIADENAHRPVRIIGG